MSVIIHNTGGGSNTSEVYSGSIHNNMNFMIPPEGSLYLLSITEDDVYYDIPDIVEEYITVEKVKDCSYIFRNTDKKEYKGIFIRDSRNVGISIYDKRDKCTYYKPYNEIKIDTPNTKEDILALKNEIETNANHLSYPFTSSLNLCFDYRYDMLYIDDWSVWGIEDGSNKSLIYERYVDSYVEINFYIFDTISGSKTVLYNYKSSNMICRCLSYPTTTNIFTFNNKIYIVNAENTIKNNTASQFTINEIYYDNSTKTIQNTEIYQLPPVEFKIYDTTTIRTSMLVQSVFTTIVNNKIAVLLSESPLQGSRIRGTGEALLNIIPINDALNNDNSNLISRYFTTNVDRYGTSYSSYINELFELNNKLFLTGFTTSSESITSPYSSWGYVGDITELYQDGDVPSYTPFLVSLVTSNDGTSKLSNNMILNRLINGSIYPSSPNETDTYDAYKLSYISSSFTRVDYNISTNITVHQNLFSNRIKLDDENYLIIPYLNASTTYNSALEDIADIFIYNIRSGTSILIPLLSLSDIDTSVAITQTNHSYFNVLALPLMYKDKNNICKLKILFFASDCNNYNSSEDGFLKCTFTIDGTSTELNPNWITMDVDLERIKGAYLKAGTKLNGERLTTDTEYITTSIDDEDIIIS